MEKIAIIKLGAKGDVIRTLPIVKAIKEKYKDSTLSLITKDNVKELLQKTDYLDKIHTIPFETDEEFDVLYNFDIDDDATNLANRLKAKKKMGFYNDSGFASAYNLGAEYYLNTLFDDETKKTNKKTYQEMMFEAAELPNNKILAPIELTNENIMYAENFIRENNVKKENLIGIHMGTSPRWPSKIWNEENLSEFIKSSKQKGFEVLLFGGPDEIERQKNLFSHLRENGIHVHTNNPNNTDGQFAALVNSCKAMVCSDSFALHISMALKKPTIGLFFCTSPDEVESYGLLKKIISPLQKDFFPEKMDEYSEELTKSIKPEEVFIAMEEKINGRS